MMNLLALGLVLTSLITAGFFPPNPQTKSTENVILKEGHRVVVVEYDKDDGNTKILISPQNFHHTNNQEVDEKGFLANANDKLSEKMDNLKEGVKESASSLLDEVEEVGNHVFSPRELVCDAYGKCKHKIASTFGKTEEEATEKVQEAKKNVKDSTAAVEGVGGVRKEGEKELREILMHAREVARELYDYVVAPWERVPPVAGVLHLMGFAAAYGMSVWITFASSNVLAAVLPRQQFLMVQSKIYPVYFKAVGYSVGMALLGHLMGPGRRLSPASAVAFQGFNLVAALAMILMNLVWLEPRATKVILERMKKEKEDDAGKDGHATSTTTEPSARVVNSTAQMGRGPIAEEATVRAQIMELNQTLQRLNSYSSFLNALVLVSLTWHLVHLSQCMQTTC